MKDWLRGFVARLKEPKPATVEDEALETVNRVRQARTALREDMREKPDAARELLRARDTLRGSL